jgi:hypothetical protein
MNILAAVLLVSLVLAGCTSTPIAGAGGDAAYRHPTIATSTPAPLAPRSDVADVQATRPVDLAQVWILGKWETFEGRSGRVNGVGQFEFRREGAALKWRMLRSGWVSGVHTTQTASGAVTSISESAVELSGKYESSNLGNVIGTPVEHAFTRDGTNLRGFEAASDGTQSLLSLRRAP